MLIGVINAGIDVIEQQAWLSAAALAMRSSDGAVYQFMEGKLGWVSYVGRPLLQLDVVTMQVDLTRELPRVKFAVNGAFGRQIILQNEKLKQLRFFVVTLAKDATVEII